MKNGKKPEQLIKQILEIGTNKEDLIVDFFSGSGTTAAVAHKMGRQYIGIEQIDYGENDSVVRLKNVINGDKTGISKFVGWQGGGDFVYCELKQWNDLFVQKVQRATSKDELAAIWQEMKHKGHLSYLLDIRAFDSNAEAFDQLTLKDQKRFLIETLDKNQLYVNYSEIEDADYQVSDKDKALNRQFYKD